jgi:3-hydroxyisobutyrate dehydrogenase-like beta-hydroxyacid dehydrogenase
MGTSGVSTALSLASGLAPIQFVDSPVSGSVPAVESGQLLVMASGHAPAIASLEPILSAFAKRIIRVGDVGAGQSMKLSVNLIVHALNSAVAEGLALAVRSGIEPAEAYEVFENSSIAAPYVLYKKAAFLAESASVAMSLDLVNKDLGLIEAAVLQAGLRTPVLDGVRTEVSEACDSGRGAADMSDLVHHLLTD